MTDESARRATTVRLLAVELRIRIEQVAFASVVRSFPGAEFFVPRRGVRSKLAFLVVAHATDDNIEDVLGLVRSARHIYARTSDVLHGRISMLNLTDTVLVEWRERVTELERLAGYDAASGH